jgi:hypothetical protein
VVLTIPLLVELLYSKLRNRLPLKLTVKVSAPVTRATKHLTRRGLDSTGRATTKQVAFTIHLLELLRIHTRSRYFLVHIDGISYCR